MKLTELAIENFMSVRECATHLDNRGLVLIQGINEDEDAFESNGAGKSTVFSEAPAWCLFGETVRGYKGDSVINRHIGKNTRVSLKIIDDNGDEYEVIRHRKHTEHKNHVLLFHNGENITAKSDTDTDKKIEELLELDFLSFTNSILFGQGVSKMFASATDGEQKKVMERMLQIDIFKACQDRAKEYLKQMEGQRQDIVANISSHQKQKKHLEDTICDLQAKEAELGEKVQKQIEKYKEELNRYNGQLSALMSTEHLEHSKADALALLAKVQKKLDSYREYDESKGDLLADQRSLEKDIKQLSKEQEKQEFELSCVLDGKVVPKTCGYCGQEIPTDDPDAIAQHIQDTIDILDKQRQDKRKELQEVSLLLAQVNKVLEGRSQYEDNKQSLREEIADIKAEIKSAVDKEEYVKRMIKSLEDSIKQQEQLLETSYADLITDNINQVGRICDLISRMEEELIYVNEESDKYEFWVNAFGNQGIKSVLLDSVTPYLNTRANHYLGKLADSSIEVSFSTQTTLKNGDKKDKFSVDVTNKNGSNDYTGNSGGERRRIDLAVNLALQDLVSNRSSKRMDFIMYDEAFENMDAIGCEMLIDILQEKAKACGTILVVTHNDSLKQLFTRTLQVVKRGGETVIKDEGGN